MNAEYASREIVAYVAAGSMPREARGRLVAMLYGGAVKTGLSDRDARALCEKLGWPARQDASVNDWLEEARRVAIALRKVRNEASGRRQDASLETVVKLFANDPTGTAAEEIAEVEARAIGWGAFADGGSRLLTDLCDAMGEGDGYLAALLERAWDGIGAGPEVFRA